jgi:hypothetical protein
MKIKNWQLNFNPFAGKWFLLHDKDYIGFNLTIFGPFVFMKKN